MFASTPVGRWERLPGWEMIAAGLDDVAVGRETPFACVVWIAAPRLRRAGLLGDSDIGRCIPEPERVLYRLLRREPGDAYSRYNAILRRLVRFEHALDREAKAARCGRVGSEVQRGESVGG